MRIEPGAPLHVLLSFGDREIAVGRLALDKGVAVLEYSSEFIASGLTVNPLFEPPATMLVRAKEPRIFDGLHGIFADSLPDAWGELLVRRRAEANGIAYSSLTALDKLAVVGRRGMGALTYRPEAPHDATIGALDLDLLAKESRAIVQGEPSEVLGQLEQIGGSSGGARPKVLAGMNHAGEIVVGARDLPDGFEAWIVKFRGSTDIEDIGPLEAAYGSMARVAGLEVSDTTLLASHSGPGYFATKRFDRGPRGLRLHVASVAGLLDTQWAIPTIDYDTILKVTMAVTRQHHDVEQMFHRMVFNVLAHNRDDHAKQHAFLMDAAGTWRLAPAYDLTFSRGPGGEHYLAVDGKGANISLGEFVAVGKRHGISAKRIYEIVGMTSQAIGNFGRLARDYGVSAQSLRTIGKELEAQISMTRGGPPTSF